MALMDREIQNASALIIDSNSTSRSLLSAQLRDLGVQQVRQASRVSDARVILEHKTYDIVLCDYHFDGTEMSGQDLLDELRREHLLPYSTVFVMVTGEASYAKVAEAAEAALDAYLIKPYTSASLADRLAHARHRKRVLKDIFEAIEKQEFEAAAAHCLKRFNARAEFWLYAARIGAELLLRLNRHEEAHKLYDAIIEAKTVPWARLGVARSELAAGNLVAARRTLETLIGDIPDHADSYDVMGRVQMEQGELEAALETYRTAAKLTPGCLLRQQRCGSLAFYAGQREESLKMMERTMAQGLRSKLFDMLSLVLIGFMRFDNKDIKGLKYAHDAMVQELERRPQSKRLQRFEAVFRGLRHLAEHKVGNALELARQLSAEADGEDFDLEAASLLVGLWIRLSKLAIQLDEMGPIMSQLGLRFCTSKASSELLVSVSEDNEAVANEFRSCHTRIFGVAETAMRHSMRGSARTGVELLIQQGESTRNAKLIDMASLVLKRHAEKIDDAEQLAERISELQARYVIPIASLNNRNRAAGGLALRTGAPS
ncbi:response regulator [Paucibacter aquatile]|uniref:Response regulator n=1 Tax=Kinneretia aquatilis TaxID=2070761 RepID=A0A2N8KVI9_9BURK|nr:response regulator [Paucibacter aquatile]MCZ8077153.1 response regulator [Roseateles sp.]OYU27219.1 MAG: response regulator [Burkholderiales bacterium PBB2]PND37477.1 response regulator [Paucibacter aquatile]